MFIVLFAIWQCTALIYTIPSTYILNFSVRNDAGLSLSDFQPGETGGLAVVIEFEGHTVSD